MERTRTLGGGDGGGGNMPPCGRSGTRRARPRGAGQECGPGDGHSSGNGRCKHPGGEGTEGFDELASLASKGVVRTEAEIRAKIADLESRRYHMLGHRRRDGDGEGELDFIMYVAGYPSAIHALRWVLGG